MSTTDAETGRIRLRTDTLTSLHWIGVALAAVTGVIHLLLGVSYLSESVAFGVAFLVAALGFFGGIAAVLVDYRRRATYALGIAFTLGQIVVWFVVNDEFTPVAVVDKLAQAALVVVLAVLLARSS